MAEHVQLFTVQIPCTAYWGRLKKRIPTFVGVLSRHVVMCSPVLRLKVKGSSTAVLTHPGCDQAMEDCEFSEKGKREAFV